MKPPVIKFRQDYEAFALMNGNRNLNRKKIEKIKNDVTSGFNLLPLCPIIVFEKENQFYIVDGQHRFVVSMELELPVYYIISSELSLFQVATMNSKQEKWKEKDFLNCYIELGIPDYLVLRDICNEFDIGIQIAAELLQFGNYTKRREIMDDFRDGSFQVNHEVEARELLQLVTGIFGRYTFSADRNLYVAVQMIKDKGLCDFEFLKEKVRQAPMMMDRQTSHKEYIYNIERVYNHKVTNRKVIF